MASAPEKNTRSTQRRRRKRRRRRMAVGVLLLAAVVLVIVLLVRLLGKVSVSSGDIPSPTGPAGITTTSSPTSVTATQPSDTADTTRTTATTTKPTTSNGIGAGNSYVQPEGADWNLVLVNDWNEVPASYETETEMFTINNQQLDKRIEEAVRQLLDAGSAYNIYVVSGYRPRSTQERLYNNEVQKWRNTGLSEEEARIKAATVVKQPGHSEHNLGLAMDLGGSGNGNLNVDFEETPAFRWLIENCADYGFILRFPKDGEDQTGVTYEPWHYRYVGVEAAQEIMSRGITLEEYLAEKGL